MKNLTDLVYDRTFAAEQEITDEVVDFYQENPEELDMIIEEEEFHAGFLGTFFGIGLGITIFAKTLMVVLKDYANDFVQVVVLDVISQVGIAIFGGTLVTYFIEYLRHKQFKRNQDFRKEIQRRIKEREG